jgi:hypothetical protein
MVLNFTGCSPKNVDDSKKIIKEYYQNLENGDVDSVVLLLDKELLTEFGDKENFKKLLSSRLGFLGKDVEYEVVEATDEDKTIVYIEIKARYNDSPTPYQEVFELQKIDNEMKITNIYLEHQQVVENTIDALFNAYNNEQIEMTTNLFGDSFYKNASENDIIGLVHDMKNVLGKYISYEILDEKFCYDVKSKENIISLYKGSLDVTFKNGNAKIYIELCREKSGVKILDIHVIPDIIQCAIDNYFKLMKDLKYNSILDMYLDVFYKNTDGGREGWKDELRFINEYGSYDSHQILSWEHIETELDDTSILKTCAVGVNARFGDTNQYNVFKILLNPDDNRILYHTIEIEEK